MSLYQFAECLNKLKKHPKTSKEMKEKKDENEMRETWKFRETLRPTSVSS